MTPQEFRAQFPALDDWVWLDTPGAPPGARPVIDRLEHALDEWLSGSFDWADWDSAADSARAQFARYTQVDPRSVATLSSLAEAAATVVRSVEPGKTIVVAEDEFRSVLFPALNHATSNSLDIDVVPRTPGRSRTDSLLDAIDGSTGLVMVSEVLTNDGERVDLDKICNAAHSNGALVFANLTQTLGVLRSDLSQHPADFVAAHGYKWMLCPRGTTWLVTDPSLHELDPLIPSWKTVTPQGYFGGPYTPSQSSSRCNSSPAWLSWIGARSALDVIERIPETSGREHCLELAATFEAAVRNLDFSILNCGAPSHIVVAAPPAGHEVSAAALRERGIRATVTENKAVRVGFHYFNSLTDVDQAIDAIVDSITSSPRESP